MPFLREGSLFFRIKRIQYNLMSFNNQNHYGFGKDPSVPLGAGLRFNFLVAAHPNVRRPPKFLRALDLELFAKPLFCRFFQVHQIIQGKGNDD
jgi:hypothetical protein